MRSHALRRIFIHPSNEPIFFEQGYGTATSGAVSSDVLNDGRTGSGNSARRRVGAGRLVADRRHPGVVV